jgi:hypothetical protein
MANEFVVRNGLISLGSVQVTGSMNVSGSLTTNGVPVPSNTDFYAYTASNNATVSQLQNATASIYSTTSSFNTRIGNLESFSSSLDSTYATDAQLNTATQSLSSSLTTTINNNSTNFQNYTSSINSHTSSINSYTSSNNTNITTINSNFNSYTSSNDASTLSQNNRILGLNTFSASINNYTASQNILNGKYTTTGSNTFVGTQYISNTTNATSYDSTPALYTDGGFRIKKDAYVSGSMYVKGNLTVEGTSSIQYVTSSVFIGLEYIDLNTDLPAIRYAGIRVSDSGSQATYITASLLWDSQNDKWIYSNPSGSSYSGGMLISGPRNLSGLGNEVGTTSNALMKGQGGDHITSSLIMDNGSVVSFPYDINVTGSVIATNLSGSLNGTYLIGGTIPNSALANNTISGKILGSNLDTLTIGTGLSGTSYNGSGAVTIANTGVLSITTNTGLSTNASATGNVTITNTGVTSITAGTGISRDVSTGGVTITNTGVTSNVAGTGISVSGGTGAVTITNTGVTSAVAGTGVGVSAGTGAVTFSIGQAVATSSNVQFNSLGVGTAGSGTTGEIRATADITAYYSSDERLKENITPIENPIEKLMAIKGVTFSWKEGFDDIHSHIGTDTGVIAQDIEAIDLPDTVITRENGFKAVKYEKLNALLIEGFKAQQAEINELKALVNQLLNK